jgi:4-hydroxy-3-methylbut-2-enyl diphosphate reductase
VPTYHIEDASSLIDGSRIRHLPLGGQVEETAEGWLPPSGALTAGITAGASTPNSDVGRVIERLLRLRGVDPERLAALTKPAVKPCGPAGQD